LTEFRTQAVSATASCGPSPSGAIDIPPVGAISLDLETQRQEWTKDADKTERRREDHHLGEPGYMRLLT
jgi:hypothetical protein